MIPQKTAKMQETATENINIVDKVLTSSLSTTAPLLLILVFRTQ